MSNILSHVKYDGKLLDIKDKAANAGLASVNATLKYPLNNVVAVGDSYAADLNNSWASKLKEQLGMNDNNFHIVAKNGYGFNDSLDISTVLGNYANTLSASDKEKIDAIICCCGANDFGLSIGKMRPAFKRFKAITDTFPNARVYIGMIGAFVPGMVTDTSWVNKATLDNRQATFYNYKALTHECKFYYLNDSHKWFLANYFGSDYVHPNAIGSTSIANTITSSLTGGFLEISRPVTFYSGTDKFPLIMYETTTKSGLLIQLRVQGTLQSAQTIPITFNMKTDVTLLHNNWKTEIPIVVRTGTTYHSGFYQLSYVDGTFIVSNHILSSTSDSWLSTPVNEYISTVASYTIAYH